METVPSLIVWYHWDSQSLCNEESIMLLSPIINHQLNKDSHFITKYITNLNWDEIFAKIVNTIIIILALSLLFFIINSVGKKLIKNAFRRARKGNDYTKGRAGSIYTLSLNIFHYIVLFFYFYAVLSVMGIPVGTLIAGAGIVSVAIGLGAQGFVTDVVTGLFILMEQQFAVGDAVKIGTITGTIHAVGLRTTQVKGYDGTLTYIPNRSITIVSNMSRNDMQALINIPITPNMDIEKMEEIIMQVNKDLTPQLDAVTQAPALIGVVELPSGQLVLQTSVFVQNGQQAKVKQQFLAAYLAALQQAGIELPVTTQQKLNS